MKNIVTSDEIMAASRLIKDFLNKTLKNKSFKGVRPWVLQWTKCLILNLITN